MTQEIQTSTLASWNRGSTWLRWDPHLHTPETLLNDQFGASGWDEYLHLIECASPPVVGLGITDYFSIRGYKKLLAYRNTGRIKNVRFVFANVELRITPRTTRGSAINLHLLVSPDDPEHIEKIEEALQRLTFRYRDEDYPCSEQGLIRLGRALSLTAVTRTRGHFEPVLSSSKLTYRSFTNCSA
jgi:hypothetical protein